jgi:transketolase
MLARTLAELANDRDDILFLTADLGFMALEPFSDAHPAKFFNVGVSEQNMIGMATGLAEAGFKPYTYSIATFATLRPYEFIRNGPVAHNVPVRIVGVGAGFEYGTAGNTHHCLEELAALRPLRGLTIVSPADALQARTAFLATVDHPGPIYFRLSKDDKTTVPGLDGKFQLGRANTIRTGSDVVFVTIGLITAEVVKAADALAERGIESTIVVVSSMNPHPTDDILEAIEKARLVVTVEEHSISGGLGSLVCEIVAENSVSARVVRCGVRTPPLATGSHRFYLDACGLTAEKLARTAESEVTKERLPAHGA